MATRLTQTWQKNNAEFTEALAASQDRFVNYQSLYDETVTVNQQLITDGILLPQDGRPFSLDWTQNTHTLTVLKLISDMIAFDNIFSQYDPQVIAAATANGWTLVSTENTPE